MTLLQSASVTMAILLGLSLPADAQGGRGGQRGGRGGAAPRDNARVAPTGTGGIAGRVVAADSGRPVRRARVVLSGGGRPSATTTDDQGRYRITGLPAGTYRLTVTKTGFVDTAFGQRRALREGSPIELADNQQVADADVRLVRGGVITGHVFDEDGEPLSRAIVSVLRSQYVRGEKRLTPAGTPDQTDDRGQFRIYGLPSGDYFVSATAGGLERAITQISQQGAGSGDEQTNDRTGYAPTYYPGVTSAGEAGRLKLAASQELGGVDFSIQVVPFATVRGVVAGGAATVLLLPDSGITAGGGGGRGGRGGAAGMAGLLGGVLLGGQTLRTQTQPDGSFVMQNVTPGRYTIVASVGSDVETKMAIQPLLVAGEEVTVALTPASGVSVSGTITLEAGTLPVPASFAGFRVALTPLDSGGARGFGLRPAEPQPSGRFAVDGVFPGRYVVRADAPRGWVMKAVYLDGRDVTDETVDIKADALAGLNVIFTDKIASLSGTVRDRKNATVEGLTVIAFPQDEAQWLPQSRQILTARSDKTGAYRLSVLPAGDYFVVAVDDVEQGEWFDPSFLAQVREAAIKITIGEGEQRTQELKAPSGS